MKKYIIFILAASCVGAAVSIILMYQHYFPFSEFGLASCGGGLVNPCAVLRSTGFSVLFGMPIAGYGLIAYLFFMVTASVAVISGEEWHAPCFAVQVPVAAASIIADVALGSILIYLGLACRLCIATYIINILICVSLFMWYLETRSDEYGVRLIYRNLRWFIQERRNRPTAASFAFTMVFIVLFVVFLSAFMNIKGNKSELSGERVKKFEEYYYSLKQEDVSLPESIMAIGDPGAEIRISAFTDFLCTACFRFYEVEKYLFSRFPGKIRVDYYNFPLDIVCNPNSPRTVYPNSCVAAGTFIAAAKRGIFRQFLEYHYEHFRENMSSLHAGDVLLSAKQYFRDRSSAGEYDRFLKDVLSEQTKLSLNDDIMLGKTMKIRSVPTLFINGRRLEGIPDAELLEIVLSGELKR
jgi:protein-disulfide isomerase